MNAGLNERFECHIGHIMSFKDFILEFRDAFNAEKRVSTLLEDVNKRKLAELKNEVSELVCSSALLCRLHFLSCTRKYRSLEDITIPLQPVKPIKMAQCLQLFERTGQRDSYLSLIEFASVNTSMFAQALYLFLSYRGRDSEIPKEERQWMCYATFPAVFHFLLGENDQNRAFDTITNMIKLHFFLHGPKLSNEHSFLNDLVFSCFLTLNPGHFFENSVLPLIPGLSISASESEFQYLKHGSLLSRVVYWRHIAKFVDCVFQRMKDAIPLLPSACRTFIRRIDEIDLASFPKRHYWIFDVMFRGYIKTFVDFERPGLREDVVEFIRCCYEESFVESRIIECVEVSVMKTARASLENFLNLVVTDPKIEPGHLSDGLDFGGRQTLLTPLDLSLIYRCFAMFRKACGEGNCRDLEHAMLNVTDLKTRDDDSYMLFRGPIRKLTNAKKCDISEIEQLVSAMAFIDIGSLSFATPNELITHVTSFGKVFLDPSEHVKIGLHVCDAAEFEDVLKTIRAKNTTVQTTADRLASDLYYVSRERKRHARQIERFRDMYITRELMPAITEHHGRVFCLAFDRHKSPTDSLKEFEPAMMKLLEWIKPLKLSPENVCALKRMYFWKYTDQIEMVFKVQETVNIEKATLLLNEYAQLNRGIVKGANKRKMEKLGRAVQCLQNITACHNFKSNAYLAIRAMDVTQVFDEKTVAYCLAMSGNGELFCLHRMINVYVLQSDVEICLLFTDKEQKLLNCFVDVMNDLENFGLEKGIVSSRMKCPAV